MAQDTVKNVKKINDASWANFSSIPKKFSRDLKVAINGPEFAGTLAGLKLEIQDMITSLPADAAQRARDMAFEAAAGGVRAKSLVADIQKSGKVSESRAKLIARTEIARATTMMTQTRAASIGSEGYIWRSSHDGRVRESHLEMDGEFVRWDSPPTLDGLTGHAGSLPSCRCYPEPVIPDEPKFTKAGAEEAEEDTLENIQEVVQEQQERDEPVEVLDPTRKLLDPDTVRRANDTSALGNMGDIIQRSYQKALDDIDATSVSGEEKKAAIDRVLTLIDDQLRLQGSNPSSLVAGPARYGQAAGRTAKAADQIMSKDAEVQNIVRGLQQKTERERREREKKEFSEGFLAAQRMALGNGAKEFSYGGFTMVRRGNAFVNKKR